MKCCVCLEKGFTRDELYSCDVCYDGNVCVECMDKLEIYTSHFFIMKCPLCKSIMNTYNREDKSIYKFLSMLLDF